MSLIDRASAFAYSTLEWLGNWIGLPAAVERSLDYRASFAQRLPPMKSTKGTLWIHGSSLGELEDLAAFFLDEKLLAQSGYTADRIIMSSASVSAAKKLAEWQSKMGFLYAGPIPPEKDSAILTFLERLNPEVLVMSHSDIWPRLVKLATEKFLTKGIVWIPAKIKNPSAAAKKYLRPFVKVTALRSDSGPTEFPNPTFLGSPRIDRILERRRSALENKTHPLARFDAVPSKQKISILIGSAWTEDVSILAEALETLPPIEREKFSVVIIPHEVGDSHLTGSLQSRLPSARVIAVAGILAESYQDFDLAIVGGGFRSGLHNVLEPALWGIPIACGPLTRAQPDVDRLVEAKHLRVIQGVPEMTKLLGDMALPSRLIDWKKDAEASCRALEKQQGASQRLASLIAAIAVHSDA